jgi:hypothetical protein
MEFIKWLVTSSADPSKYSATIKGVGYMGVAYIISLLGFTCASHLFCVAADGDSLKTVVDTVATIAQSVLLIVGGINFIAGFVRKLYFDRWSAYPVNPLG